MKKRTHPGEESRSVNCLVYLIDSEEKLDTLAVNKSVGCVESPRFFYPSSGFMEVPSMLRERERGRDRQKERAIDSHPPTQNSNKMNLLLKS